MSSNNCFFPFITRCIYNRGRKETFLPTKVRYNVTQLLISYNTVLKSFPSSAGNQTLVSSQVFIVFCQKK